MKGELYNFFVWISGTDTTLLRDCPESEHKKYALQGGLILIPTVLAFLSMLYASNLISDNFYIQLILSFIWAAVILIIDRYLLSTFIKNKTKRDWLSIQFFVRIVFSISLGVVISHPIVLRVFDDKISETQKEIWLSTKKETKEEVIKERNDLNLSNYTRRDTLIGKLDNLNLAIVSELGGEKANFGGYTTSKHPGKGIRVLNLGKQKTEIEKAIKSIDSTINKNILLADKQLKSLLKEKKESLAAGYWSKDDALMQYLNTSEKWSKYWFILAFFIFIDVTAVLLKVFTKSGEYDQKYRDREKHRLEQKTYSLIKLSEKKKHYVDERTNWEIQKTTHIFNENTSGSFQDIQKIFVKSGLSFDDNDITETKKSSFISPIIKDVQEVSRTRLFYILAGIGVLTGFIIAFLAVKLDIQTTAFEVTIASLVLQTISTILAGVLLELFKSKNKS